MGTIIQLNATARREMPARSRGEPTPCEVVIFPGVRIERHEIDLSHRMLDSAGREDFGGGRPRKTS